jgi:predicted ribosome quality control (RQC) complex YloA/Tae2 family protein
MVGRDWIRLGLQGDSRPGIMLTGLPGAVLVFSHAGRLPAPLTRALPSLKAHPLSRLLADGEFSTCGMFPADRIAAIRLRLATGQQAFLIHQLFGPRGNTVLLDDQAKVLWARHRPPHSLLAAVPPDKVWDHGQPSERADFLTEPAVARLTTVLLEKSERESRGGLERRLKAAERLVENLTRDLGRAEKGDLYRRRAEALAAHLHEIPAGAAQVEVSDPRDGQPLVIALDPALTPAANLEAWFRRARKADRGRDVIAERLAAARSARSRILAATAAWEQARSSFGTDLERLQGWQSWREKYADLFPAPGEGAVRSRYGPEEPARPFRRYLVDDRWEVWIGRNNRENDELTHRAAHGRDIWLHAQGVPGSHVILRTGGKPEQVPRAVLAKAARLAALNSKARHSGLVPVIFTEQRYVRKPRKSPPGVAVCLREKSLFVEPGVPPGAVGI